MDTDEYIDLIRCKARYIFSNPCEWITGLGKASQCAIVHNLRKNTFDKVDFIQYVYTADFI